MSIAMRACQHAVAGFRVGSAVSIRPRSRQVAPAAAVAALLLGAVASACADGAQGTGAAASNQPTSFSIAALSRGKGVPAAATAVLAQAEEVIAGLRQRGADITMSKERIGLEGETRLCVTFTDENVAEQALARIRTLASGVDLVDLGTTPCSRPP